MIFKNKLFQLWQLNCEREHYEEHLCESIMNFRGIGEDIFKGTLVQVVREITYPTRMRISCSTKYSYY